METIVEANHPTHGVAALDVRSHRFGRLRKKIQFFPSLSRGDTSVQPQASHVSTPALLPRPRFHVSAIYSYRV